MSGFDDFGETLMAMGIDLNAPSNTSDNIQSQETSPDVENEAEVETQVEDSETQDSSEVTHTLSDSDVSEFLETTGFSENLVEVGGGVHFAQDEPDNEAESTEQVISPDIPSTDSESSEAAEVPEEAPETTNTQDENLIPWNSPTLLMNDSVSRFSGTEWFNEIQTKHIIVAGCGGIGSNLIFQLARMSPRTLAIYDDDTVEFANMSGQLFGRHDVGKKKVNAIANMLNEYTTASSILSIPEKFTEDCEPGDIMMCGFDNMSARKTFFQSWYNHIESLPREYRAKCLYLDGRLSIDTLQIFCIRGDDQYNINRYSENYLFSDSEADETICSMKQTTYLACMIGSLMVNLFTNFVANGLNPVIPYDLPFFTEYDSQSMMFKTQN